MSTATLQHRRHAAVDDHTGGAHHRAERVDDPRVRQREVSGVGVLVLAAVVVASLHGAVFARGDATRFVDPGALRIVSVVVAVGFLAYAIDQDRRLRALEAPIDGPVRRVPVIDLTLRLHNAVLLGDVVAAILADVRDAVEPSGVEVRLLGLDGVARTAGIVGARRGEAARVAIEHDEHAIGEIVVHGPRRPDDARLAELACLAGAALDRARQYEHALRVLGELHDTAVREQPTAATLAV